MCVRAGLMMGWDDEKKRVLVSRANCDSWGCPECAKRLSEKWGHRAELGARKMQMEGDSVDFVTITSHEKLKTFMATEMVFRTSWNALYCAIKRQKRDFQYMIVPERHKDGRMHVHAIWNGGVSQKWLKDNARKRGLGYQCKVISISHSRYATKYVTKYLGKDLGVDLPPRFRRVRVSRNWPDIPEPTTTDNALRWEYVGSNGALSIVYRECAAKGIAMIDKETGAYFDDQDLSMVGRST